MSAIVSNTGPLIALGAINRIDILKELFTEVIVPAAVHIEVLAGGKTFAGKAAYQKNDWIEVHDVQTPMEPLLAGTLDCGEASVILLARQMGVSQVLMDEKRGRKIARDIYGLQVMGTVSILLRAKHSGIVANIGEMLDEMRSAGYWLHNDIVRRAIREAGEE